MVITSHGSNDQGGCCDDICVDELRPDGWRLNASDCQHHGTRSSGLFMNLVSLVRLHIRSLHLYLLIVFAGNIRLFVLLHHITQASSREEDFPDNPPTLHHRNVHHHCWGWFNAKCWIIIPNLLLKDLEAITQNIGWLGATMSFAYCSAPLASIQEVTLIFSNSLLMIQMVM